MTFKNFAKGLLVGGLAGAVYGLLTTKRSGQENRDLFNMYTDDVKEKATGVKDDFNRLTNTIDDIQNFALPKAQHFQTEVDSIIQDFQKEAEPRQRRIQKQIQHIQEEAQAFQKNI